MKKYFIKGILCLLVIMCMAMPALGEEDTNLLYNGDFELMDDAGLPLGWGTSAWITQAGYTQYETTSDAYAGDTSGVIQNFGENDARFAQVVELEPNSLYCLSGYIKAEDVLDAGWGANLSIENLYIYSDTYFDTEGQWEKAVLYGETGPDQTTVTVYVRLGGYSGESQGKAYFDDISLVKVEAVPEDVVPYLWYKPETIADDLVYDDDADEYTQVEEETSYAWLWLCAACLVYILFFLIAGRKLFDVSPLAKEKQKTLTWAFFIALAAALLGRGIIAYLVPGYTVDINCFLSWGNTMASVGPGMFYQTVSFCDYPPVYMYILGLNDWITGLLGLNSRAAMTVIAKLVPMLCDVIGAWLIFHWGKKRINPTAAAIFGLLYALNPATIVNSAAWGQVDSVLALGILLTAYFAMNHKWSIALPVYMVTALMKPQAFMMGPLGLAAVLMDGIHSKKNWKDIFIGLGIAIAAAALLILPFYTNRPVNQWNWLIELYGNTLSSYNYPTLNTANLYYLLIRGWGNMEAQVPKLLSFLTGLIIGGAGVLSGLDVKKKSGGWMEWISPAILGTFALTHLVLAITGATYGLYGTLMMVFVILVVIYQFIRGGKLDNLALMGGILFLLLYVFGVKMHERYLAPAFLLLAYGFIQKRDIRILPLLIGGSVTMCINVGIVLDNCIRLGAGQGHLNGETMPLSLVLCVLNICLGLYAFYVAWVHTTKDNAAEKIKPEIVQKQAYNRQEKALLHPEDAKLHMKKWDYILIVAVTLIYSVVALWNLGSTKAPENAWTSSATDEQVILDLGESQEFAMLYFARVSYFDFTVSVSDDKETWQDYPAEMKQGECFQWKYLTFSLGGENYNDQPQQLTGRYVRISADQIGLTLCEVLFRDGDKNILPVTVDSVLNQNTDSYIVSSADSLIDEQDTLVGGEPSWYNGTYFDEIYHARTGYEHAHAYDENAPTPYEYTHPPLGKLFMALSIKIFGMNPFGWRFAGAFTGILMLPAMYLLVKQLTRRRDLACAGMLLLALDCMHLTQTRIATIDSFPVLFIILQYFFMLRFMKMDFWGTPMGKLIVPLGLSGLCMGLGIASKWIGIYAGAGLGVLYFWHCIQLLMEAHRAKRLIKANPKKNAFGDRQQAVERAANMGWSRVLLACLWCVLFFVAIPAAIYYIAYIPFFAPTGGISLERLILEQERIFEYHAKPGLGMDHAFYSPWWEWPVIGKPMYYASARYIPAGWSYAIFCFGNPIVWYSGLAAFIAVAMVWLKRHMYMRTGHNGLLHWTADRKNTHISFVLIGLASQFLPWVAVPRGTYIYHYFASVPFIILCTMLCFGWILSKWPKAGKILLWGLVILAAIAFIGLYPYASGTLTPIGWLEWVKKIVPFNIYFSRS